MGHSAHVSRRAAGRCRDTAPVWHAPPRDALQATAQILRKASPVPSSTPLVLAARVVGLALLTACGAGAGSFEVRMAWGPDGPPEAPGAFVLADVREVELDATGRPRVARGRVIGEATPVPLDALRAGTAELRFAAVPNGPRRVVVVEVRAGATRRAELLRYGVSTPFTLVEGEVVVVTVTAGLTAPPRARPIAVEGFADDEEVFVRDEVLRLRLTIDSAVRAEVSGFDTFPADDTLCLGLGLADEACADRARAAVVTPLDTSCAVRAGTPNPCSYAVTWDLGAGLDDHCGLAEGEPTARADRCARTVYVRAFDADGVASETEQRDVVLDTRAPELRATSVDYTPPATRALITATEAGVQTQVRLELAASEPVRDPPALLVATASSGATLALTLTPRPRDALGLSYTTTITDPAQPTGEYRVQLALRDRAGNVADVSAQLPGLRVRTSTPVLVVAQERVSYLRSPVGRATAEVLGRYTTPPGPRRFALGPADPLDDTPVLPSDTFRLGDGPAAALRVWADETRDVLLLPLVRPDASGAWPREGLELPGLDTPRLYVTALDAAGNESAPVLIETVWWVGSSAGASGSPHALTLSTDADHPRATQLSVAASGAADAPDARGVSRAGGLAWRRYGALEAARDDEVVWAAGMAWDATLGELQLTNDAGAARVETASWDGYRVQDRTSRAAGLDGRSVPMFTFDARRGRSVGLSTYTGETLLWDGLRWEVATTTAGPAARFNGAMTYDPAREQVLVYGGATSSGGSPQVQADTWIWDGTRWRRYDRAGPGPRNWHRMTYDPVRERVILFGGLTHALGLDRLPPPDNTLWAWTGDAWAPLAPATTGTSAPSARYGHVMTYELSPPRVIVAGGYDASTGRRLTDTWSWDGHQWSRLATTSAPSNLFGSGFDGRRQRAVAWGGPQIFATALYAWAGDRWVEATNFRRPPAGYGGLTVHDTTRRRTLVLGRAAPGAPWDTWAWDGVAWSVTSTTGPAEPTPPSGMSAVYDEARAQVVVLSGSETWLYDGARWTRAPGRSPPPRTSAAMTYDAARAQVVVFGGRGPGALDPAWGDTWVWDGVAWTEVAGAGPPPRADAMLADDAGRARLVLHGGVSGDGPAAIRYRDTWEWDGAAWVERTSAGLRPPVGSGPAVYHAALGRLVWALTYGAQPGLWSWDGAAWAELTPLGELPTPEPGSGLAYDPDEGAALFRGGASDQQWRLEATPPAVQLAVRLGEEVPLERVEDVRVRGACGGRAPSGDGARLVGWSTRGLSGGWQVLARNAASPLLGPAAALDYRPAQDAADTAQHLVVPAQRTLYLQCRPDTDDDRARGEVSLDYLEARVKYRLTAGAR